jgi:succinate dehydrogenase / fumarate reductase, cytochrome b subunit
MVNHSHPSKFLRWFDPRNRQIGTWAFILNRITALGLTLYLTMHLVALSQLAQGPAAYDTFVAFAKNPYFKVGEMLVIAAGCIHGLNGIRIALNSFGIGVRFQKETFVALMALALCAIGFFGYIMFFGA